MESSNKPNSVPNQSASNRPVNKGNRKLAWLIAGLILITTLLLLCILPGSPALGVFLKLPEKAQPIITTLQSIAFDPVGPSAGGPTNVEFPVGSSITVDVPPDLTRPRPTPTRIPPRRPSDCILISADNVTGVTKADPCPTSSTPKPPAPPKEPPVGFPKPKIMDFGDAPDEPAGHFPSLLSSDGARHIDINRFYLGKRVDVEKDSRQVDEDSPQTPPGLDDGTLYAFLNPIVGGGFGFSGFLIEIHNNDWPEESPIYLNALYDTNFNKTWDVPEEHIVIDKEFYIPQGHSAWYLVPFVTNIDFLHWLRLTVTDIPLGEGYDGSWPEAFAYGETEDYIKLILPPPPKAGVYHREEDSLRVPPTDEPTYTPGSPGSATFDPYYWTSIINPNGFNGLRARRPNLGFKAGDFIIVHQPGLSIPSIPRVKYSIALPLHGAVVIDPLPAIQKISQLIGVNLPDLIGGQGITLSVRYYPNFVTAFTRLAERTSPRIIFQRIIETVFQPTPEADKPAPTPTKPAPEAAKQVACNVKIKRAPTVGDQTVDLEYNFSDESALNYIAKNKNNQIIKTGSYGDYVDKGILFGVVVPEGASVVEINASCNTPPLPVIVTPATTGGGFSPTTPAACGTISLDDTLPDGQDGRDYGTGTITASGGTGPYTYAVTAGSLPTGLSLSSGGLLTGTPVGVATYTFTVTATATGGCTGSRA